MYTEVTAFNIIIILIIINFNHYNFIITYHFNIIIVTEIISQIHVFNSMASALLKLVYFLFEVLVLIKWILI